MSEAEKIAKGWLAASFNAPGRNARDLPLCLRSRTNPPIIIQETTSEQ